MSNQNNNDGLLVLLVIATAFIAYCVWKFSEFFGLDMATGWAVCLRLFLLTVVIGLCWKIGEGMDQLRLGNMWPILLALLWACWWPALDYYATKDSVMLFRSDGEGVWWAAWYTKWGVGAGIVALGYAIKKWFDD